MDGQIFYIDEKKETASQELAYLLQKCMRMVEKPWKELVFLCIGSDRITGDSLGPLIGRQLLCHRWQHSFIYGTLEEPVHALNLASVLEMIKKSIPLLLQSQWMLLLVLPAMWDISPSDWDPYVPAQESAKICRMQEISLSPELWELPVLWNIFCFRPPGSPPSSAWPMPL